MNVRISGVYHSNIISYLKQTGIEHFSFDLRPRSLNFTQIRVIQQMIEQNTSDFTTFYAHFEDDKDYVITETLKQLNLVKHNSNLWAEFSGKSSLDFYEQFKTPYIWHYNETVDISRLGETQYLRKISFQHEYLERLLQFGKLYDWLGQLTNIIQNKNITFEATVKWDSAVMETLIDFFPFSSINYQIDHMVESTYRQVDLHLMAGHIESTKRSLNI